MSSINKHRLTVITYADVENALKSNDLSLKEQREYNTNSHSYKEIAAVLPHVHHFLPQSQPWILLEPFLPLIMATQGYGIEQLHQIPLPKPLVAQLARVLQTSSILGHISESDKEDFEALFPGRTTRDLGIDELTRDQRFFIRLDACSLKDALQGSGPAKDTVDLWSRLATSMRGMRGATDLQSCYSDKAVNMWLLPWQEMRPELEYRVFCPPPGSKRARITAISQYHWHEKWVHAWEGTQDQSNFERLIRECDILLQKILQSEGMTEDISERGFVFDVAEGLNRGPLRLIELNSFGAMTGCGSCLFNWIRDAEMLYGLEDEVEVRVTY